MGNHKIEIRRSNVEKILLGAEKVFAEKGFGGTAMADAFPASRAIPGTVTTVDSALIVHEYRLCAIMTML